MRVINILFGIVAALVSALVWTVSASAQVYPGCDTPGASPSAHFFYIDPVKGSMSGDGSAARPWRTLAQVVQAGLFAATATKSGAVSTSLRSPPIRPGDTVYLLTGDHGAVVIQGASAAGVVAPASSMFVTIAALPGQAPVLDGLKILGASHWAFRGLTFQGLNTTGVYAQAGTTNADPYLIYMHGPHDNIIIDSAHILSSADTSKWTIGQWLTQRSSGIWDTQGTCIALTNNYINNIGFGIYTQQSDKVLIAGNIINYFSDDGIDYGSSDLLIQNNVIENSIEDGDGFHRDGMQGQPSTEQTLLQNVTIQNNTVLRIADPALPYPAYLQGIDEFDGLWKNMTIYNNIVITDAWDAIAFDGAANITINDNYVLVDNRMVLPCYGLTYSQCLPLTVIYDPSPIPGIFIEPSKAGLASSGVAVTNNIVTGMYIGPSTLNATLSNNLCLLTNGACAFSLLKNGSAYWVDTPGVYGADNVIANFGPTNLFTTYNTTTMQYNLTEKRSNPAQPK